MKRVRYKRVPYADYNELTKKLKNKPGVWFVVGRGDGAPCRGTGVALKRRGCLTKLVWYEEDQEYVLYGLWPDWGV